MLIFNIYRVLAMRGAANGIKLLTENGFTRASAANICNFEVSNVKVKNLERLCRILNCTPNDFFEWRDAEQGEKEPLSEAHALNALRRENKKTEINNLMRELPLERLDEVENYLKQLKSAAPPEN